MWNKFEWRYEDKTVVPETTRTTSWTSWEPALPGVLRKLLPISAFFFIFFQPLPSHSSCSDPSAGTFCALDICLSQIQDVGTLNVCQTVRRMRTQRAFSIQTPDQYYFCYNAILEHAQRQGLLPANQWAPRPLPLPLRTLTCPQKFTCRRCTFVFLHLQSRLRWSAGIVQLCHASVWRFSLAAPSCDTSLPGWADLRGLLALVLGETLGFQGPKCCCNVEFIGWKLLEERLLH